MVMQIGYGVAVAASGGCAGCVGTPMVVANLLVPVVLVLRLVPVPVPVPVLLLLVDLAHLSCLLAHLLAA